MNLTTLRSGQLVHVYGTPPQEFGIYLEEPRSAIEGGPPKRVYFYFHRSASPASPGAWRPVPFNSAALWLLAPLQPIVRPRLVAGRYAWRIPTQEGVPDVEIRWAPGEEAGEAGAWTWGEPIQSASRKGASEEKVRRPG